MVLGAKVKNAPKSSPVKTQKAPKYTGGGMSIKMIDRG